MPLPLCCGNWLGPGWVCAGMRLQSRRRCGWCGAPAVHTSFQSFKMGKRKIFKTSAAESRNRLFLPVWTDSLV